MADKMPTAVAKYLTFLTPGPAGKVRVRAVQERRRSSALFARARSRQVADDEVVQVAVEFYLVTESGTVHHSAFHAMEHR